MELTKQVNAEMWEVTYLLVFIFQKELSKGKQSILAPKETVKPVRNPGTYNIRELEH